MESFFGLVCQVIVLFLFGFVIYILIAVFDNCFCLCHFYLFFFIGLNNVGEDRSSHGLAISTKRSISEVVMDLINPSICSQHAIWIMVLVVTTHSVSRYGLCR